MHTSHMGYFAARIGSLCAPPPLYVSMFGRIVTAMSNRPHDQFPAFEHRRISRRAILSGIIGVTAIVLTGCAAEQLPARHRVTASEFHVGEASSKDNAYISNKKTAWDDNPVMRFGGVDDPNDPPEHVLHNRYYFALPVNEFNESGLIPGIRERSPWRDEVVHDGESLFKGRWIKVTNLANGEVIYAQWLDTGPCATMDCNDPDYVFGSSAPKNDFGLKAGLDLSPTAMKALSADGSANVEWQFVDESEVPSGPWRDDPPITNKTHWQ